MQEATPADVERIESLTEEDFEIDFSKVQIPEHEGRRLSDGELIAAADSFVNALRSR
jgi:hypothetical protein